MFGVIAQALFIRDLFNLYNPLISGDWTLLYETQFYMVCGLAWLFYKKTKETNMFIMVFIGITITIYFLLSFLSVIYGHGEAAMQRTGGSLFCFLGTLFYLKKTSRLCRFLPAAVAIWFLGTFCYSFFFGTPNYGYFQVAVTQVIGMTIAIACINSHLLKKRNKLIGFVANISFPMYLLHQTFGTIRFSTIVGKNLDINIFIDRGITFFLIIIPACIVIHNFIERPLMRMKLKENNNKCVSDT